MMGRRHRFSAGIVVLLGVSAAAPAQAQVASFFEGIFGKKTAEEPQAAAPAEPTPDAPAARAPAPPKRPAARATKAPDGKAPDKAAESAAPRAAEGGMVAAAGTPTPIVPERIDPATAVAQANGYFNGITTLTGTFMQIGADGRRIGGKLTLAKPGRLRFDYDQPSPLEIVADGTSVAIRDRKLVTQQLYFIAQTPLKFLLRDKIDLARDLTLSGVESEPQGVRIALEDRATLGGTSRIVLYFDPEMRQLTQWRITDPQGFQTTVMLSNLQRGKSVDASQFFINYGRAEDKAAQQAIEQAQRP